MSTENAQADVASSGENTESVSANTADVSNASTESAPSLENLTKIAKDAQSPDYKPKSVEDSAEAVPPAETLPPAFEPNFKYKAALQEKEIEEFWRPLIKDADSEQRVKEALTKLDGFDSVKSSREKIFNDYQSLQGDYSAQAQVVQRVESALERGDLSSAFRQLGLKDEDVFKYTQSRLQMMDLPPEQQRALQEAEEARHKNYETQDQITQLQQMYETQAVQARTMQLDFVLSRPDVSESASKWDSLTGKSGAFRDLIIQEAQAAHFQQGVDLSADQAAQRVLQKFGSLLGQNAGGVPAQVVPQAQAPLSQTPYAQQTQSKPVIPAVTGQGATPIKKAPRSLDDLKKIQKELEAGI